MTKLTTLYASILIALLASSPAYSWEPSYWFGGGGVLTNYSGDFFTATTSETQWPVNLGGTVSSGVTLGLTDSLGIHTQAGLTYNRVNFFDITGMDRRRNGTQLSTMSIDLSPMLRVYINAVSPNLYIGLGFNASYLIKCSKENFDKGITNNTTGNQTLVNQNFVATNCLDPHIQTGGLPHLGIPWLLRRFDFGLTAGTGFGYRSDDNMYISFDLTYKYNFSPTIFKEALLNIKTQSIILAVNVGIPI